MTLSKVCRGRALIIAFRIMMLALLQYVYWVQQMIAKRLLAGKIDS